MLGNNLLIAFNGILLGKSTGCEVTVDRDTIEVCPPVGGEWRDHIASVKGWSISANGLLASPEQVEKLLALIDSPSKVRVSYYDRELHIVRSGYALVTSVRQSAQMHSLATYSITLTGCGALTKYYGETLTPEGSDSVSGRGFAEDGSSVDITDDPGSDLYLAPFTLTAPARVSMSTRNAFPDPLLLCKDSGQWTLKQVLQNKMTPVLNSMYRLAAVGGSFGSSADVLLLPGKYAFVCANVKPAEAGIFSKLSLPTT